MTESQYVEMVAHLKKVLRVSHMAYAVALKSEGAGLVVDPIREAIHQIHKSLDALGYVRPIDR